MKMIIADLKELDEGIVGSVLGMHFRDLEAAAVAAQKYLGIDTLALERKKEFEALPETEQETIRKTRHCEKYGMSALYVKPEVTLALTVLARECFPDRTFVVPESFHDPVQIESTAARFPAMNVARIRAVLG